MGEHRVATGIALFALSFALGIGSMAVASHLVVRRSDIVDNAVNGAKVARNTLAGRDVREASLGTVPRSARVDGSMIRRFAAGGAHLTDGPVVRLGGLRIDYECTGTDDAPYPDVTLSSSVPNASVVVGKITGASGLGTSGTLMEPDLDPGESISLGSVFGHVSVTYSTPSGRVVAGNIDYLTLNTTCDVRGVLVGG